MSVQAADAAWWCSRPGISRPLSPGQPWCQPMEVALGPLYFPFAQAPPPGRLGLGAPDSPSFPTQLPFLGPSALGLRGASCFPLLWQSSHHPPATYPPLLPPWPHWLRFCGSLATGPQRCVSFRGKAVGRGGLLSRESEGGFTGYNEAAEPRRGGGVLGEAREVGADTSRHVGRRPDLAP